MIGRNLSARWFAPVMVAVLTTVGCHGGGDFEPLAEQKIYVADRFFDVAVRGPKEALVIGYGGKMLRTTDAGFTWEQVALPTDKALYSIDFADDGQHGWMVGEQGLILRTTDGGATWTEQKTDLWLYDECKDEAERKYRAENDDPCQHAYLFAIQVIDENTAHVIGDKATYTRTTDGGKTWETFRVEVKNDDISADLLLAVEDPVLYDVEFIDADRGWIVGEFGKIFYTEDGGDTWGEQQQTVMDASVITVFDLPTFFDIEFTDAQNGMVAGLDGRIAVTTDGGKDWNFVPNNVEDFVDPFYSATILPNGQRWVVGASGQIVRSGPGEEFARGSLGSAVNNWLRRIRFHDDKHGWVVGGFGLIMYTEDGGETWFRRIG